MKPVSNTQPAIVKGMEIKLIDGRNVPLKGHQSYDWDGSEIVDKVNGKTIWFRDCPKVDWFTIDMPWKIIKE